MLLFNEEISVLDQKSISDWKLVLDLLRIFSSKNSEHIGVQNQ